MKKMLICMLAAVLTIGSFAGCGQKKQVEPQKELTPADMQPQYYESEDAVPANTFCIAHKQELKKGKAVVRYYPLLQAENYGEVSDEATGMVGSRFFWLNYNKDEGMIPTMYPGDKMVFKTSADVPDSYTFEKFFDEGYTIGVAGLYNNSINKVAYSAQEDDTAHLSTSADTQGLANLGGEKKDDEDQATEIVFNKMNNNDLTQSDLDPAGMIAGLDEGKTYTFDLRVGSKSYTRKFRANMHEFILGETYKYNSVDYVTDEMIRVNMPDFLTTGYYELNGAGAFRYLKTETDYKNLTAADYNDFIYTYTGNTPTGSRDGLVLNDDGYLVTYEEYSNQKQNDLDEDDDDSIYDPMQNEDDIFNYTKSSDDKKKDDKSEDTADAAAGDETDTTGDLPTDDGTSDSESVDGQAETDGNSEKEAEKETAAENKESSKDNSAEKNNRKN